MNSSQISPTVRWKLGLAGDGAELQALAKMFAPRDGTPGVQVWFEDPRYYLHAPEFEDMTESWQVIERGEILVRRLNGLGRLKFGGFRPVQATIVASGSGGAYVHPGPAILYLPTPALRAYLDYTPHRPPVMNATVGPIVAALPPTEEWVSAADRCSPDVDDALYLLTLAAPSEDWRLLYVVYEIIEDHHARQPTKVARDLHGGGAKEIERFTKMIGRFRDTANSRRVLGTKARHGHDKKTEPADPMTFEEAKVLVQGLLLAWVKSIANSP
jgi:hypothetical protein